MFNASVFIYRPYDGMAVLAEFRGTVTALYKNGPAEKAGIKINDRLLAVNNLPVTPWLQRPIYPANLSPGETVIYTVERDGKQLEIDAVMESYWSNPTLFLPILGTLALSITFWIIGTLLCLFAPLADFRARLIGLCWLMAGLAAAAGGPGIQSHFWGSNATLLVTWACLGFFVITTHIYFPSQILGAAQRRVVIICLGWVSAILSLLEIIEDFVLKPANMSLTNGGFYINRLIYAWFFLAVITSIGLLMRSRFLSREAEIRRQTGILLVGMVLGFGPFFVLTLIPALLFGARAETIDPAFTILFLAFIPLAYAYVIHQRRLLRLDYVINRLVVFFILTLLVLVSAFAILSSLVIVFDLPPQIPLYGSLAAAFIAFPSAEIQKKVQVEVNRILYGTHYDHATVTASLSSELARTLDRDSLTNLLSSRLAEQMGVQRVQLYLMEKGSLNLQGDSDNALKIDVDDELCCSLLVINQPVRAQNFWVLLTSETQERWRSLDWAQLIIPITFEDNLTGLLVLGSRLTGDVYSAQDITILGTVAHQTALAVANIHLVDNLRGLNQQLVRAEDERRKKIARELHDTVLQDLFFVKQEVLKLKNATEIRDHFDTIIQRLRSTIHDQRPNLLEVGLTLALDELTNETNQKLGGGKPFVHYRNETPSGLKISEDQSISIYRIVQEALNNAIKHAQANHVTVSLSYIAEKTLCLVVTDDGKGINGQSNEKQNGQAHYGLLGMKERAEMIKGSFTINSEPLKGTRIELKVPL